MVSDESRRSLPGTVALSVGMDDVTGTKVLRGVAWMAHVLRRAIVLVRHRRVVRYLRLDLDVVGVGEDTGRSGVSWCDGCEGRHGHRHGHRARVA